MAHIIKNIIEEGLDNELQKTQFGFRKGKSTANAIFTIRRIMDKAERSGSKLGVVLLDWEKAFDKITHSSLMKALERYRVPKKLINLIKDLYKNPTFKVNSDGT